MERENSNKTRKITIRLTPSEYTALESKFKTTTCRKLSEYMRKQLFGKAIISTYRNRSLDDFVEELIVLRNELNAIGNNLNQTTRKLHTLSQIYDAKEWTIGFELKQRKLFEKINEIHNHIQKISEQWFQ
ncbi:plasmid mobilization relaxosome protein MobC [Flavobacterium sp. HBTb2-11-1]|uniref:plasmid mobilization protein n=1 Tax=Flavobacterium sp. HBTb2-11-1 TaxID=2692212 RepID=UPI00136B84FA|nr:plasmid mobilization relaxosome protein MobC [Flavobacterium sp. HBTb2-11-1]MXO04380.1 plasmid mobilization relaxosome protein MobC [Flavobacterium sp. HBTb2-11-1]